MTWNCTSINTRWPSGPSSSMFEVYLDKLDKDLQHLQEMATYINGQNQPLLSKWFRRHFDSVWWWTINRKWCRPFLYCNLPTNVVYYVGYRVLLSHNTTDTFRRSKRICLRHSLTFSQNTWDNKAAQIKGDKQFSWHLNDIYQHAFKHTKIFIGISRPFKESLWYTPTCHIRQLESVDIVTTGQLPSSAKTEIGPCKI